MNGTMGALISRMLVAPRSVKTMVEVSGFFFGVIICELDGEMRSYHSLLMCDNEL